MKHFFQLAIRLFAGFTAVTLTVLLLSISPTEAITGGCKDMKLVSSALKDSEINPKLLDIWVTIENQAEEMKVAFVSIDGQRKEGAAVKIGPKQTIERKVLSGSKKVLANSKVALHSCF